MKSNTAVFKDLDPKFGTVNYSTDICTIAIEQNTLYSMAASEVVEIYIQENQQQENLQEKLSGTAYRDSSLQLRLSNFIHK